MSETAIQPQDYQDPRPPAPLTDAEKAEQAEAKRRSLAIIVGETGVLAPANFGEQWAVAQAAVNSGLIPVKKTAEAWLIMQRGAELGFPLLTAVEFLYPVEGRLRLSPDGAKALALRSQLMPDFREYEEGEFKPGKDGYEFDGEFKAICYIQRRGIETPIVRTFSVNDAKQARLWPGYQSGTQKEKVNWRNYPRRMLAARARGFAFQDAFRDVTGGMQIRERFDLDHGERIGGVVVAPPAARDITPVATEKREAPKPARVTFSAPLVVDAEVVEPKAPEVPTVPDGSGIAAEQQEPTTFDLASAEASLRAECSKRTAGDTLATADLFREVTAQGLASEQDYNALAAIRQHPAFGDNDPPVLTSPQAEPKGGGRK